MRKRRIPEWLEAVLLVLASVAAVAAVCLMAWCANELRLAFKCAFGV